MTERIVDVFDKNSVCIMTYTVQITAFNLATPSFWGVGRNSGRGV